MNPVDLGQIKARLEPTFKSEAAHASDHVYQFCIGGEDAFHLEIRDGTLDIGGGAHPTPSVTFMFEDVDTALGIVAGNLDPIAAFMAGKIRTDGNLILALQLRLLFQP